MATPAIHSSSSAGNNGHPGLSSWTSLNSMNSTAGASSPRSTRSNSLTNSNPGQLSSFGSGSGSSMHSRSTAGQAAAGVPQPTQEELGGRTYLEWIRSWNDDHVAQWLTDNRCATHALTFANNDIRGDVILDVDQQALKEMGVQSVGDRIKITVAVKKLRQACTAANISHQLAARRPLNHSSSIASLQSSRRENLASNPSSPVNASHPGQAVVAQAQLARRVSGGKSAHRVPPPLHLTSSSAIDSRLPQAYQTNAALPAGTSSLNAATYGARTSSNAANAVLLAAPGNLSSHLATSPRWGHYPSGTAANKTLPPPTSGAQVTTPSKGPSGSRSQQHLAAPSISTTAASPTLSSPSNQWSHRKAGSLGGSMSSGSSGSGHPFAAASQAHGKPSTSGAAYQQSYQQATSPSSPTAETLATNSSLHASPYRGGHHAQKPSFGNSGLSPIVEANSGDASPILADYHSTSRPAQHPAQGFTVGKGGFSRPTTSGGVVSIGATSGSGQVMPLEDVLRKTVKFISDDDVSKMVSLDGAKDVHEVLVRVLKKFNKIPGNSFPPPPNSHRSRIESGDPYAELGGHGILTTNGDGVARALSEGELWNICQSASRPERSRGLLLRRIHTTPTSPEEARAVKTRKLKNFFGEDLTRTGLSPTSPTQMLDMSIPSTEVEPSSPAPSSPSSSSDWDEVLSAVAPTPPQKPQQQRNTMNRASTVSIMSGLNWGFGAGSGSASQAQTRSPSTGFIQTNHQKLRSFFGQRPPSELINTHLVEYFPTAASEKKILSKQVRNNVRKSMLRRNSSFNPALSVVGKTSWDASGDNQSIQGFGVSRFSMSSAGSNHRDSVDTVPPLPSKEGKALASRFSEDYDLSPNRSPMLGHLSTSSAAPSISIDSDDDETNDTRSISSGVTGRTTRRERPSSRLSVWSHSKSNKDSDTASVLTVEEITEDLEKRRLSRASWAGDNASELAALGDESGDGTGSEAASTGTFDISDETLDGSSLRSEIIEEEDEDEEAEEDDDNDEAELEEEEEEEEDEDEEEADADLDLDVPQTVTAKAKKSTFRWVRGALIGAGSFGQVYLGMNAANGTLMAVKQVELPTGNSHNEERKKSMLSALEREIELLKEMQHENVVQYLDSSSDGTNLYIFLEYVPGGSVTHLLSNYGSFEEPLVRTFVKQILRGLAYLHENDIIHRDIKGANILVDNRGGIKISDFGISKKVEDNLLSTTSRIHRPSLQGSVFWMAPEVVKQTSYTAKADIWSLGCLIVEMFTGQHPWMELTQMQAIFKIGSSKDARPKIPSNASAVGQDFLDLTFHMDYNERPTAAALSKHAFVTEEMEE